MNKINNIALEIIKEFEGFKSKPYLCSAGIPTIGYGSTYYANGKSVTMKDKPIDELQANILLENTVSKFQDGVNSLVKSKINENKQAALISFAYNLGLSALKNSTLLKKVNSNPQDLTIAQEFNRWINANGVPVKGLINRRNKESQLYFS